MNALFFNPATLKGSRVIICGASTGIGEQIGCRSARAKPKYIPQH